MLLEKESIRYISWVNQVLDSLGGSNLDDFRVCFDLGKDSECHIDRWIQFVIGKRVRMLELDLKPSGGFRGGSMRYNFPLECYAHIKQARGLHSIKSLTSLCLKYVNISGELVEYFLSNCPLERLCVVASEHLLNLKVSGSSLQLKYLEISQCFLLKSFEISAPNLVSLKYFGQRTKLRVHNIPLLVELFIGWDFTRPMTYVFRSLSSYFSQLETLLLKINLQVHKEFTQFVELTKLKHLILRVDAYDDASLLGWTNLIKASPFLHRFTLELVTFGSNIPRKMQKTIKCPHRCLKVVEMIGFVGHLVDFELAMYLLENASMLETIIVDRRHPLSMGTRWELVEMKEKVSKKVCFAELRLESLPLGVKLVII